MRLAALVAFVLAASCGYRPANDLGGGEKLSAVLATSSVPDAAAADEVLAGVREELAKRGALAPGSAYPRCEVEVLRADEASEGIEAQTDGTGELVPGSRATRVGLVARGWIVRSKDGPHERDTGDVRAIETIAVAADAKTSAFRHADALKAAGRRLGRRIASRLLGLPAASDD